HGRPLRRLCAVAMPRWVMLVSYLRDAFCESYTRAQRHEATAPSFTKTSFQSLRHVTFAPWQRTHGRVREPQRLANKRRPPMFSKLAIATVIVVASLSSAMAASNKVYVNGKYIGTDPDPTVRAQLAHDPAQGRE